MAYTGEAQCTVCSVQRAVCSVQVARDGHSASSDIASGHCPVPIHLHLHPAPAPCTCTLHLLGLPAQCPPCPPPQVMYEEIACCVFGQDNDPGDTCGAQAGDGCDIRMYVHNGHC